MSRLQLLDDVEGIAWLLDVYPFVQDGKPIAAAIVAEPWISVFEINDYRCKPRVWCVEGHTNEPELYSDGKSYIPPKECAQCNRN